MRNALLVLFFIASGSIWAQYQVSTYPTITVDDTDVGIGFEIRSTSYITITGISNTFDQTATHVTVWIREGGIRSNGQPPFIDTSNGWVPLGDCFFIGHHHMPVQIPLLLNYPIVPNKLYGIYLETDSGVVQYRNHQSKDPLTYTDNTLTTFVGPNGYGGAGRTPAHNMRDIVGTIHYKFTPTINDAGITNLLLPKKGCAGSIQDINVELSNLGTNQINNLKINWSVNGVLQPTFAYNKLLDAASGSGQDVDTITIGSLPLVGGMTYDILAWTEHPNGTIDFYNNNDTSRTQIHAHHIPSVNIGHDTTICTNDSIVLDAGNGHDSLRWNRGATNRHLVVDIPGTYIVDAWKNGCLGSDTIDINTFPALPKLNLGNDTVICYGSHVLLDATAPGVKYLWHDNSTLPTYMVDTTGNYAVTIEDTNTCKDSDDINVSLFGSPSISISVEPKNTICNGLPFEFTANSFTEGSTMYQWKINTVNSGSPTSDNKFSPRLHYGDSVSVDLITDVCSASPYSVESNYITMYINPEPKLINGNTETDTVYAYSTKNYSVPSANGSIFNWRAFGGNIINDPVGNSVSVKWGKPYLDAKIMVNETDSSNCFYSNFRNVVIMSSVGIVSEDNQIAIGNAYPNPSNSSVTIPIVSEGNWSIDLSLYTVTGKKVKSMYNGELTGNRDITFEVDDLESGIYFYKISTSNGYKSVKKLIIQH